MKLESVYEWIEPKCIMALTLLLILFDNWGTSMKDGFSRWTVVRCGCSLMVFLMVINIAFYCILKI